MKQKEQLAAQEQKLEELTLKIALGRTFAVISNMSTHVKLISYEKVCGVSGI